MIRPSCLRIGPLLDRPREALSDAQRLLVENHLSGCSACARTADVVSAVREVARGAEPSRERPDRHERAISLAFEHAESRGLTGRRATWRLFAVPVLAAVAAVIVVLAGRDGGSSRVPMHIATQETGKVVELGPARVSMSARTEVSWEPEESMLRLRRGAVDLSVEPTRERPFRVATDQFVVEVLGTSFYVDTRGVRVVSGVVTVRLAGPSAVARTLRAGDRFRIDDAPLPAEAASEPRAEAGDEPAEAAARTPGAPEPPSEPAAAEASARAEPAPSPSALLERARLALLAGDVEPARRDARAALSGRLSRRDAAEARMLLAECAQLGGATDEAVALYSTVARRYPDLEAAEAAMFASARIHANARRLDEARAILRAYLERYPAGRFRRDVTARLRALEGTR